MKKSLFLLLTFISIFTLLNSQDLKVTVIEKHNDFIKLRIVKDNNEIKNSIISNKKYRKFYIVKKNDTLWKISNMYKIRVDKIFKINKLKSTLIIPGQKIYLEEKNDI